MGFLDRLRGKSQAPAVSPAPAQAGPIPTISARNHAVVSAAKVAPAELAPFCPHCGAEIVPPPTRKRKCPHCGEVFLVRTRPENRQRVVVTEAQAAMIDAQWEGVHAENGLRRQVQAYGATEADAARVEANLKAQWGQRPSPADLAWGVANDQVAKLSQAEDWRGLGQLYWQMALQLYNEGHGHFDLAREARRFELLGLRDSPLLQPGMGYGVRVLGCKENYCGHCLSDEVMSVDQALERMPIPRADCGHHVKGHTVAPGQPGWCGCTYITDKLH